MDIILHLFDFGSDLNVTLVTDWQKNHTEVPILAVCLYLVTVFYVPELLKNARGFKLKYTFAVWNLLLSTFSIFGAYYTIPPLVKALQEHGFKYTTCTDPEAWYLSGESGRWTVLFIFSKLPELLDTAFLVLQKKPVIFLHWFHHTTVLLYCWHAFHNRVATGLWFSAMNFSVHSIMYAYYFFSVIGWRSIARPIAPFITTLQLVQMIVGVTVTAASSRYYYEDPSSCHVDPANFKLGLAMYSSYFFLFAVLFYKLYLSPTGKHRLAKGSEKQSSAQMKQEKQVCGVDVSPMTGDAAGFFHGNQSSPQKKNE